MTTHQPTAITIDGAIVTFRDWTALPIRAMIALLAITPSMHGAKSMTDINTMTREQLIAMVAQMTANPRKLSMKVSDKGALSVYGLGRFPVTLYRGQWERLLSEAESIIAFVAANAATLTVKA